jgi:hypothetical protein
MLYSPCPSERLRSLVISITPLQIRAGQVHAEDGVDHVYHGVADRIRGEFVTVLCERVRNG